MTEGKVLPVKVDEEEGEHEDDENRGTKHADDKKKIRLPRASLLNFHATYDAESGVRGAARSHDG